MSGSSESPTVMVYVVTVMRVKNGVMQRLWRVPHYMHSVEAARDKVVQLESACTNPDITHVIERIDVPTRRAELTDFINAAIRDAQTNRGESPSKESSAGREPVDSNSTEPEDGPLL